MGLIIKYSHYLNQHTTMDENQKQTGSENTANSGATVSTDTRETPKTIDGNEVKEQGKESNQDAGNAEKAATETGHD